MTGTVMEKIQNGYKILLILLSCSFVYGQNPNDGAARGIALAPDFVAEKVAEIRITKSGTNWLTFRTNPRLSPSNFFTQHHQSFLLSSNDDMILDRSEDDA